MATFTLTTGLDTFVGGSEDDTVNGTAATLNSGDRLTGGAGTDVLALYGSGIFHVDQLAIFTGFESITLNNFTSGEATLYLGNQSIAVTAVTVGSGYESIYLGSGAVTFQGGTESISFIKSSSAANWNAANVIDGSSQNNPRGYLSLNTSGATNATYDLTTNTLTDITNLSGYGSNLTVKINSADAAGVSTFDGSGANAQLVTADTTLNLSHSAVTGFTVRSTNATGTTFIVKDLGTAFQIAGGSGQDTIATQVFSFTVDQRNAIFATNSVEFIIDASGNYTAGPPDPNIFRLTTSPDTFVGGSEDNTVNGTAATLNSGDRLTGGAGTDVLALYGSGIFHVDQLAIFTGFESITLNNFTSGEATLYLGNQSIAVTAVTVGSGYESIYLGSGAVTFQGGTESISFIKSSSAANWNAANVIDGSSQNNPRGYLSLNTSGATNATYDLTTNTLTDITNLSGYGSNLTVKINSADAAGVSTFDGSGANAQLVTADTTLNLSHSAVTGFTVRSTNATGTTFIVKDLGTAFQIAGGSGQDTIATQVFSFTVDQRNAIFATNSVEFIIDASGNYTAGPPDPNIFRLTTSPDTFVGGSEDNTVNGTAATLNSGDRLTGGAGTDVLALYGSGIFHVDQLAIFTGFESITLNNFTSGEATLYLGNQSIAVTAVTVGSGYESIYLGSGAVTFQGGTESISFIKSSSAANWNAANVIDGSSQNNPRGYLSLNTSGATNATYDLTTNTLTDITNLSGYGSNLTVKINSADAAGVSTFDGSGANAQLVTADTTLNLSHSAVTGFTVRSTNATGTTFIVKDLGTAFQIAGGSGQDIIATQVFSFTVDQRNVIFATNSVEFIIDASGTYTKVNYPPHIVSDGGGDTASIAVTENRVTVTTVAATDPDTSTTFSYSIVGGEDAAKFQINQSTGALSFTRTPDYELPSDYDHNNSYVVLVRASDGTLADDQTLTVNITDVNEAPVTYQGAGNFDGNQARDVVFGNEDGILSIWDNARMEGGHTVGTAPLDWNIAAFADFAGDSISDIVFRNAADGRISVWDNGSVATAHSIDTAPLDWHIAAVGNFDNDSKSDLLWRNDDGSVAVWEDGQLGRAHSLGWAPLDWHIAGKGNFDGNTLSDILWRSEDGRVALWNDGSAAVAHTIGAAPLDWQIIGAGDFDGNGTSDILWVNNNGSVALWTDGKTELAHTIGAAPLDWHVAGIGDFNNNGKLDILWRNDNGTVAIWDDGLSQSGHTIGQLPSDWHIA